MWLARGGPPEKKVVWYEYHPTRAGCHAKKFLEGYRGYLQTDGYEAYDSALKDLLGIVHVGCFAHARRKFYEVAKASKERRSAQEGLKYIRTLYTIENELRDKKMDGLTFVSERKARAGPVLEKYQGMAREKEMRSVAEFTFG
jgi:transposase